MSQHNQHPIPTSSPTATRRGSLLQRVVLAGIALYRRFLSPISPPACRFFPSCSAYGQCAVERHGGWLGSWMTLCRIARCHPWHPGGWDPVPEINRTTSGHPTP